MDDYIQIDMTSVDDGDNGGGSSNGSGGGCLSYFLACILVFGGIGYSFTLFQ